MFVQHWRLVLKLKPLFALFVFLFAVAGCKSTSPYCSLPKAKSIEDETTIVIYRPDALYGVLYSTPFSINGCRVDDLSNNTYQVHKLPAGKYTIAAEEKAFAVGGDGEVFGDFKKGQTYYVHYSMSAGDFYSAAGIAGFTTDTQMAVVDKDFAYKAMPQLAEKGI